MEDLLLYSLYTILALLVPFYLFLLIKKPQFSKAKLPPGSLGWPVLGENVDFATSGPRKFIEERINKYSSQIFKTSFLGEKVAVFCGPAGNKFLFSNEDKVLTSWLPKSMRKALLFPSYVDVPMKEVGALQHSILHEILKPEALKKYIPVMDAMARKHLDAEWAPFEEVKVYHLAKKYTFALACRLFMNIEDPDHVKRLSDPFARVMNGLFSIPLDFPGAAYNGAIKGGNIVREELLKIVRNRKKELMEDESSAGRDVLSRMILVKDEDGKLINEMDICNNIVGLLVASFDTTSCAVTFVLKRLSELPHIYDKVYQEIMEIAKFKGPDDLLGWEDIQKMTYSWNVGRESLRLTPPAQGAFREANTDFDYCGFTIPKGWKTFWSVYSTHQNPKHFVNPDVFDPSRFEGSGPAPFTFIPFGGGPRMCPGKEYARLEILVFMYNVVTKFKMEKLIPDEKIINLASPTPVDGLPVRLQRHNV